MKDFDLLRKAEDMKNYALFHLAKSGKNNPEHVFANGYLQGLLVAVENGGKKRLLATITKYVDEVTVARVRLQG